MKAFLVVLFFIFFIIVLAGGAVGDTDLTPDTPPDFNRPVNSAPGLMASGGVCGREYVIRSGDTLFKVAQACGITLPDLLAANPTISDPNVIYPDQRINIPLSYSAPAGPAAASVPPPGPPTATVPADSLPEPAAGPDTALPPADSLPADPPPADLPPALPTAAPAGQATARATDAFLGAFETVASPLGGGKPATPTADLRNTYRPGTPVDAAGKGLPANTVYNLYIHKNGSQPAVVAAQVQTSAEGSFQTLVMIPTTARWFELWAITLAPEGDPNNRAVLRTFRVR